MTELGLEAQTIPATLLEYFGNQSQLQWQTLSSDNLPKWFIPCEAKPITQYLATELFSLLKAKHQRLIYLSLDIDPEELWQSMAEELKALDIASEEALVKQLPVIEASARRQLLHQAKQQHEASIIRNAVSEFEGLLSPPVPKTGNLVIIEPGLKSGLKLAACNPDGDLLCHSILFPHEPQNQWQQSIRKLDNFVSSNRINALVLASGEGFRESRRFIKSWLGKQTDTIRCFSIRDIGLNKLTISEDGAVSDNLYLKVDALSQLAIAPDRCIAKLILKSLLSNPLFTVANQQRLSEALTSKWQEIAENLVNSHLEEDPLFTSPTISFEDLQERNRLVGKVVNKTEYGFFLDVGIEENGLLHNSKISAEQKPEMDTTIEVTVLNVNTEKRQFSLTTGPGTNKRKKPVQKKKSRPPGNSAMADALKAAMTKKH